MSMKAKSEPGTYLSVVHQSSLPSRIERFWKKRCLAPPFLTKWKIMYKIKQNGKIWIKKGVHMPRPKRNFVEGGIYHIVQRGNNKAYIYDDQLDKACFLNIIKETKNDLPFEVLYYVIMDNHYHMILRMNEISISKIMWRINMRYSVYFNKKYNRIGTIFGSRFTSVNIKNNRQFMTVIRYNAYNPVKANIVKQPEQYKWSAHMEMISKKRYILNRDKLLELFDENSAKAMALYEDLVISSEPGTYFSDMQNKPL